MEVKDILKQCKIDDKAVFLPDIQLDRKLYQDVAKKIELIGGKWNRKLKGFLFIEDPLELFNDICNGDKRNIQKEFQFFETPELIADRVIELACINEDHKVLEPSAGRGALIKALNRIYPNKTIDCFELMDLNRKFLIKINNAKILGEDFIEANKLKYDRVIANPPFNKYQYIDHVYKMYESLNINGKLVVIVPTSFLTNSTKKEKEFKIFVENNASAIINVEKGAFKSSGTLIETLILVFDNN